MAKSFNLPKTNIFEAPMAVGIIKDISDSIANVVDTVNQGKFKNGELHLEGLRLDAEISEKNAMLKMGKTQMIVSNVITGIDSIVNIVKTIGEERRKTEELKLQGTRIQSEMANKISERENETLRIMNQCKLELGKLDNEARAIEAKTSVDMKQIEFGMQQSAERHTERMKQLDIIEKVVEAALEQYRFYRSDFVVGQTNAFIVDPVLLNAMNNTIQQLTVTISQANTEGRILIE